MFFEDMEDMSDLDIERECIEQGMCPCCGGILALNEYNNIIFCEQCGFQI